MLCASARQLHIRPAGSNVRRLNDVGCSLGHWLCLAGTSANHKTTRICGLATVMHLAYHTDMVFARVCRHALL